MPKLIEEHSQFQLGQQLPMFEFLLEIQPQKQLLSSIHLTGDNHGECMLRQHFTSDQH